MNHTVNACDTSMTHFEPSLLDLEIEDAKLIIRLLQASASLSQISSQLQLKMKPAQMRHELIRRAQIESFETALLQISAPCLAEQISGIWSLWRQRKGGPQEMLRQLRCLLRAIDQLSQVFY
jgi:hypothetical protein